MEVGPAAYDPEGAPQPDLFETYADLQGSVAGIKGSFRDLAEMCPVDLNDPAVTLEAKNEFMARAMNESGVEIRPEHEEIVANIVSRHGMERKFTVAEQSAEPNERDAAKPQKEPAVLNEVEVIRTRAEAVRNNHQKAHDLQQRERTEALERQQRLIREQIAADERHEVRAAAEPIAETNQEVLVPPTIARTAPVIRKMIAVSREEQRARQVNLADVSPNPAAARSQPAKQRFTSTETAVPPAESAVPPPPSVASPDIMKRTTSESVAKAQHDILTLPEPDSTYAHEVAAAPAAEPEDLEAFAVENEVPYTAITDKTEMPEAPDGVHEEPVGIHSEQSLLEAPEVLALLAALERNWDEGEHSEFVADSLQDTYDAGLTHEGDEESPPAFIRDEALPYAAMPEYPAPALQIETALDAVAQALVEIDDDPDNRAIAIINEIVSLPESLEESVAELEQEAAIEQKLEALFADLFEELEIDYSPELLKSFVKLTREHYFDEMLPTAKNEDGDEEGPTEIGTREFLQKLYRGLDNIKNSALHLYEIGKAALRLYRLRAAPAAAF